MTTRLAIGAVILATALALTACIKFSTEGEPPDLQPAFAVLLVQRAIDRYEVRGRQGVIDYYNTPQSTTEGRYVIIFDEEGTLVAGYGNPNLGGNAFNPPEDDVLVPFPGEQVMATDSEGQWVEYTFTDMWTGRESLKHTWFMEKDGLRFGSGWQE